MPFWLESPEKRGIGGTVYVPFFPIWLVLYQTFPIKQGEGDAKCIGNAKFPLDKQGFILYNDARSANGRLAQLVEHSLDVRRVSGSSPLTSTKKAVRSTERAVLFWPGGQDLKRDGSKSVNVHQVKHRHFDAICIRAKVLAFCRKALILRVSSLSRDRNEFPLYRGCSKKKTRATRISSNYWQSRPKNIRCKMNLLIPASVYISETGFNHS